jgi:serine protease inhibitor
LGHGGDGRDGHCRCSAAIRASISITIDHPYLFLIRDNKTGAILFAAEVSDPAAS